MGQVSPKYLFALPQTQLHTSVRNSRRRKLRRPGSNYWYQDRVAEKNPDRTLSLAKDISLPDSE